MTKRQLVDVCRKKQSFLCVGLDSDIDRIPKRFLDYDNPILEFNKQVIDATKDYCVAYKPNIAFYEALGSKGWQQLKDTLEYIPEDIFTIADAKRGDIGNTSRLYAKTFFEYLDFDSVTVAPYMGIDSVSPFLEYENAWVILLALTSNKGSRDFQYSKNTNTGRHLFEDVLLTSSQWGTADNMMYVVGATHPEEFLKVRDIVPDHFLLVPGVGAQGGDLHSVAKHGLNDDIGLLVNSSRGIIFAGEGQDDYFGAVRQSAAGMRDTMAQLLG